MVCWTNFAKFMKFLTKSMVLGKYFVKFNEKYKCP
jgi:hypothetical protein